MSESDEEIRKSATDAFAETLSKRIKQEYDPYRTAVNAGEAAKIWSQGREMLRLIEATRVNLRRTK